MSYRLISGTSNVLITDNGTLDGHSAAGTVTYSNVNFNGWDIMIVAGATHSPGLSPFALDVASLTATCDSSRCSSNPLQVWHRDLNFAVPVGVNGFQTTFSTTQTGTGSATESAWFSNLNTAFSQQNPIGTVGPFTSSSMGTKSDGPTAAIPSYSLTIEPVFKDCSQTSVSFSADGNITAVPEPAAIFLFGTVLVLCASGLRRRMGALLACRGSDWLHR
jgi:hypothetical protein